MPGSARVRFLYPPQTRRDSASTGRLSQQRIASVRLDMLLCTMGLAPSPAKPPPRGTADGKVARRALCTHQDRPFAISVEVAPIA